MGITVRRCNGVRRWLGYHILPPRRNLARVDVKWNPHLGGGPALLMKEPCQWSEKTFIAGMAI